ncbi:MAG TPA: hypothetical protein VEX13_07270 [Chloroflexia bacterium]|nr:hypothetical protein [Chloroflexia bacterium]
MIRERLRLLTSLGWIGYLGGMVAVVFVLVGMFIGIYSIMTDDDRMSRWVGFLALATFLISVSLTVAMERKKRQ